MSFRIPSEVRIQKARTTLLLDHPFFGTLLFRLGGKASRSVATMATDGVSLFYNPEFVDTLNAAKLAGVLAHEVMHPALQHHTRRGDRDQTRWNMACDFAINPMLLDAGLTLPKDVLLDERFRGVSAERIYSLIEEDEKQEGSSSQSESKVGNGSGPAKDDSAQNNESGSEPQTPRLRAAWARFWTRQNRKQNRALPFRNRHASGRSPSSRQRRSPKWPANFPEVLYGRSKPRRSPKWTGANCCAGVGLTRYRPTTAGHVPTGAMSGPGLYLPGIISEGVGKIAIAIDCSGTVSSRQLGLFEAEIRSILAGQRPQLVHVLYFDAAVQRVETYQVGQSVSFSPIGGGETDFRPCFDWLAEKGIVPHTLVFLTDLCGTFPSEVPLYSVIWASTEMRRAPFGKVVTIENA
jgi:predicted metal-dependent peptidase